MTTSQALFTVTLTAEQLRLLHAIALDVALDAATIAALDAAKPARATPKPRAAAEPYAVNTGNAELDRFMVAHHDPKWKPKSLPLRGHSPVKPLTLTEFDRIERDWKKACNIARNDVAAGKPSRAEAKLRDLVALHRPASITS